MSDPIDLNGDGSIFKLILREGPKEDKACKGDKVAVHYTGTLQDGTKFDSSVDRGTKFEFTLGKGEVIKGWDMGVASMNKGEKAKFTIDSKLAYGEAGSPPKIPANATLVFEIELFDFKGEDLSKEKDGGVIKRVKIPGEGFDHPNDGGAVEMVLQSLDADGNVKETREVKFILGEGLEEDVPSGIEVALERMKKKETSLIVLSPQYTHINYHKFMVTLNAFERAKESWQLDGDQKVEQAKLFKERGTHFFKNGKYDLAKNKYNKIIEFLEHEISLKGEKEDERRAILQAGRLNLSMCFLKMEQFIEARDVCDKVIEENKESEKAFFRRGEARYNLNDHEMAKLDYTTVLKLDPNNKAAKNRLAQCNNKIKLQKNKEKATFANMFDKFAANDLKREEEAKKRIKPVEISEWDDAQKAAAAAAKKKENESIKVSGDVEMDIDLNNIGNEQM